MDYERWKKKVSEEEWKKIQKEYEESKTKSIKNRIEKLSKKDKTKFLGKNTFHIGNLGILVVEKEDRVELIYHEDNEKLKETFTKEDLLDFMEFKKIIRQLQNKEYKAGATCMFGGEMSIKPSDDEDWDFII